jgi:hypothetical protein
MTFHYAKYRGDELIILGYNKVQNDCYLVRLVGLPGNEQEELRRIANSEQAQNSRCISEILLHTEKGVTGDNWWSYLMKESVRRNGPVFKLPLKEIQDSLDSEQRAIFKGYGKDIMEKRRLGKLPKPDEVKPVDKTEQMMEVILEEGRQNRQMMIDLIKALVPQSNIPVQVSVPTKVVSPKKTGRKKKMPVEVIVPDGAAISKEEIDAVTFS